MGAIEDYVNSGVRERDRLRRNFALADVVVVTASRALTADDSNVILRVESASPVVLTVPASLPETFNVAAAQWGAGSVSFAADAGATKRSTATSVSRQYALATLLVVKNSGGSAAEFVVMGDVV